MVCGKMDSKVLGSGLRWRSVGPMRCMLVQQAFTADSYVDVSTGYQNHPRTMQQDTCTVSRSDTNASQVLSGCPRYKCADCVASKAQGSCTPHCEGAALLGTIMALASVS